jgi:geranylgeranylglycerol-phosphate geranylgeranyltransferase
MRPETAILGILGVFIGGLVAGGPLYSLNLFLAVVTGFLVTAGSMTFNDYFDLEIDKINHINRPIPSGRLTPNDGLYFAIASFSLALFLSWLINWICLGMVILSIILLVIYETSLKKKGIAGNLLVAFMSAMAFTFGGAAVGKPYVSLIFSVIAFFLMLGREILMDVRDIYGDQLFRTTVPMHVGERKATYLGCLFLIIAIAFTAGPFILEIMSIWYMAIILVVDMFSVYAIMFSLRDIRNIGKTTDLIRVLSGIGLVGFIIGAIL